MVQIIPAILATSEDQYKQDLQKLTACEALKDGWVHIDFADNKFVQNQTVGVETIEKFPTDFHKEAHLMVSFPKQWIEKLIAAGFKRIIFHIECEDNIDEVIDLIKAKGLEVGLAIKIDTALEKLEEFIHKIDMVLVMSIVSGFQGQPFIPKSLDRLKKIKEKGTRVGPDGAVNDSDIKEITKTGADFVIVGSYLLKGDTDENMENLWEAVNG